MVYIQSVGMAVPPYEYPQVEAVEAVKSIFSSFPNIERYLPVFTNASIDQRHFSVPKDWFLENHTFPERNKLYLERAIALGEEAIKNCLKKTNIAVREIDHLIFISTTGISTPSIDAYLCSQLQFKPHMKRTPIWGLGCAGGAAGLSRAYEYIKAHPKEKVLVLSVELCSLTFLRNDMSKSNLIATSLFADGAAAVLITGDDGIHGSPSRHAPKILGTMSTLYPDSLDVMGWELHPHGLKVVFSKDIPSIVKHSVRENIIEFLTEYQLDLQKLEHFILHPGGIKVIEAYEEALNIDARKTAHSRDILRNYGNMSSATVLFILERFLQQNTSAGEYGILTALGPGFSSELVLLQF